MHSVIGARRQTKTDLSLVVETANRVIKTRGGNPFFAISPRAAVIRASLKKKPSFIRAR